jgi:hypothetical protein
LLAVNVSVLAVLVTTELKAAVTPAGNHFAVRVTLLLVPLGLMTLIVVAALDPVRRVSDPAEDERLKLELAAGIVNTIFTELASVP